MLAAAIINTKMAPCLINNVNLVERTAILFCALLNGFGCLIHTFVDQREMLLLYF